MSSAPRTSSDGADTSENSNTTLASEEIPQSADYKDGHFFSWFAHIITLKYIYPTAK